MSDKIEKASEIRLEIGVDENNVPVEIKWQAEDGKEESKAKAMILSMWDVKEMNAVHIDLWTKEMTVDEMKHFYYQTLLTMSSTFERATGEEAMAREIRNFSSYFADKMGMMTPE